MSMVCSRFSRPLVTLVTLGITLTAPVQSETQQFEGKRIVDIQFSPPEQPVAAPDLEQAITLKPNTPLSMVEVRTSIENLYATGRYEDIQVDAEPRGDGVVVRFITRNGWFVGRVSADGRVADPPNRGQMANATRLQLGQPFHEEDMTQAEIGLRKLLVDDGYYENQLQPRIEYDARTQQAHIHFIVESGPRAKYRTPAVQGNLKMAVDKIVAATRWKRRIIGSWRPVTQSCTRQGVDNIRRRYEKSNRLMAAVQLKQMDYDRDTRRVAPHLDIDAGPVVEIKGIGTKVSGKMMKQNVPVYEEHTVDRDLLVEGARNLRDEFQSKGFFEAEV